MSEIRAILVPLDEAALERRVLERALALGRRFDAVVEALHISPLPRPNDPGWEALTKRGMGFALTEDAMREAKAAEERVRGEYEKIRRRAEAPETPSAGRRFAAASRWRAAPKTSSSPPARASATSWSPRAAAPKVRSRRPSRRC